MPEDSVLCPHSLSPIKLPSSTTPPPLAGTSTALRIAKAHDQRFRDGCIRAFFLKSRFFTVGLESDNRRSCWHFTTGTKIMSPGKRDPTRSWLCVGPSNPNWDAADPQTKIHGVHKGNDWQTFVGGPKFKFWGSVSPKIFSENCSRVPVT